MKLSIIIANRNYRDFVGGAIESALAVDWLDKEVIIVDDASTDVPAPLSIFFIAGILDSSTVA
jgi:glycosyltransferase involved in cell wall biosynthesis